ncbi:RNA polymerase II mediator complex subunit [Sporothrix curviconia]|uniref:Mediator of RNA polymerase II transcription subunit 10 n=1 Tax=Sporothrix curviconia TaxID=1260050 RepID=A0ABP0BE61_9PEZI
MAPIGHSATAQAETAIRDTIQSLYNVMLHTSAYDAAGAHTSLDALVAEVRILSQALRDVNEVAEQDGGATSLESSTASRGLPAIPRDLVQYVEAGRNPDIYTREFVELVRRTNQLRAGKRGAFAQFRDTLAGQIRSALPELSGDVDRIMGATAETPQQQQQPEEEEEGGEGRASGEGVSSGGPASAAASTAASKVAAAGAGGEGAGASSAGGTSVGTADGSKTTRVGDEATPAATQVDGASASASTNNATAAAGGDAGGAVDANRSLSASASPAHLGGSNSNGTPSGGSDAGGANVAGSGTATLDMLGILPSTPQASAASGAAGGGGGSGPAGGGAASGEGGAGGQDAMETS